MRVCLIGPADIEFHYEKLLGIEEEDIDKHLDDIAMILAQTKQELVLLPERGAPYAIATRYKELGGPKVIGAVPKSDKDFGIKHLEEFINGECPEGSGKKIVDEIIDTKDWYKQDVVMSLFADTILFLGSEFGSIGELAYGYYLYKLFTGAKPGVNTKKNFIHPGIIAGERIPFNTIVYKPFMKDKLPFEIEQYIEKLGCKVFYVNTPQELAKVLVDLGKEISVKK